MAYLIIFSLVIHASLSLTGNSKQTSVGATATNYAPSHPGELEELQHVLHFPEEVALRITDAEYQLFYQVRDSILKLFQTFIAKTSSSSHSEIRQKKLLKKLYIYTYTYITWRFHKVLGTYLHW